jgi:hypothetical protein
VLGKIVVVRSQPKFAVAEELGQFGNPKARDCLPLEAPIKIMIKTQMTEKIKCLLQWIAESLK